MFRYLFLTAFSSICVLTPSNTRAQNPNAAPQAAPKQANAAAAAAAVTRAPHHPERVIVQFKQNVDEPSRETLHGKADTRLHKRIRKAPGLEIRHTKGRKSVEETIAEYQASGLVEYAEPDYVVRANRTPNDPAYATGKLWHLHNTAQSGGIADADMDAPEAWDARAISSTIVAVIDTGVRYTHEDLQGNMWRNPGEIPGNRVDDDGNGYVDDVFGINTINGSGNPADDDGHGTHVAGTIGAAGNNAKGATGVAWTAKIMACKFLGADGSGYTSDAIEAIDYARSKGARILNNSWSGGGYSQALYDAINRARNVGIIFVAAAGNDAQNNDSVAVYPANYALDNIISVAATNRSDQLASFSNYGAMRVELGAPGDQIYSTYHASDTSYTVMSGTSMAAPQVSGALALLRTHFPGETRMQIRSRLLSSVDSLPSLQGRTSTGGRLNLHRALAPAPGNDNLASAALAEGDSFRVESVNFGATLEENEPLHAGKQGGHSVWWKWTPTASGTVNANTIGSAFDTLLAIYITDSTGQITPVASNDNISATNLQSSVTFSGTAGTTYYFAVDGVAEAEGKIVLSATGPSTGEVNNAFASRIKLSGYSFSTKGSNVRANKEAVEPDHAGNSGGKSVWWTWTAPRSGYFTLDTFSSNFDTLLAIYTGTTLGALKYVSSNDETSASNHQSRTRFYAVAGRTYQFAVDGYEADSGSIVLSGRYW